MASQSAPPIVSRLNTPVNRLTVRMLCYRIRFLAVPLQCLTDSVTVTVEIGIFPWLNRLSAFSIYRRKGAIDGKRELQ